MTPRDPQPSDHDRENRIRNEVIARTASGEHVRTEDVVRQHPGVRLNAIIHDIVECDLSLADDADARAVYLATKYPDIAFAVAIAADEYGIPNVMLRARRRRERLVVVFSTLAACAVIALALVAVFGYHNYRRDREISKIHEEKTLAEAALNTIYIDLRRRNSEQHRDAFDRVRRQWAQGRQEALDKRNAEELETRLPAQDDGQDG